MSSSTAYPFTSQPQFDNSAIPKNNNRSSFNSRHHTHPLCYQRSPQHWVVYLSSSPQMSSHRRSSTSTNAAHQSSSQRISAPSSPSNPHNPPTQPRTQRISLRNGNGSDTSLQPGAVRVATRSPYVNPTQSTSRPHFSTSHSIESRSNSSELSLPATYNDLYPNTAKPPNNTKSNNSSRNNNNSSFTSNNNSNNNNNNNNSSISDTFEEPELYTARSTFSTHTSKLHPQNTTQGRVSRKDVGNGQIGGEKTSAKNLTTPLPRAIPADSVSKPISTKPHSVNPAIEQLSSTNMMHYTNLAVKNAKNASRVHQHAIIPEETGDCYPDDDSDSDFVGIHAENTEFTDDSDFSEEDDSEITDNEFTGQFLTKNSGNNGSQTVTTKVNNNSSFSSNNASSFNNSSQTPLMTDPRNASNTSLRSTTSTSSIAQNMQKNSNPTNTNNSKPTTTSRQSNTALNTSSNKNQPSLTNHTISNGTKVDQQSDKTQPVPSTTSQSQSRTSTRRNSSASSLEKPQQQQQQQQQSPLQALPLIDPPYCRETYQQLVDTHTVPKEVYHEYLAEVRKPLQRSRHSATVASGYSQTGSSLSGGLHDVPKEVERWTVKLPTRLEFRDVTIRVMKKFPISSKVDGNGMNHGTNGDEHKLPPQLASLRDKNQQEFARNHHIEAQLAQQQQQQKQQQLQHGRDQQQHLKQPHTAKSTRTNQNLATLRTSRKQFQEPATSMSRSSNSVYSQTKSMQNGNGEGDVYEYSLNSNPDTHSNPHRITNHNTLHTTKSTKSTLSTATMGRIPQQQQQRQDLRENLLLHDQDEHNLPIIPFGNTNASVNNNNNNNNNNGKSGQFDDMTSDDDDGELFSPSTFSKKQSQHEFSRSTNNHSRFDGENDDYPSHSSHASSFSPHDGLFDNESEDESDGEGHSGGFFSACLNKEKYEERPITILDKLSGVIEPGSMVAIMGSSGAGKTTLLNALSGRINLADPSLPETVSTLASNSKAINAGSICLNSTSVTKSELASMCGYVLQNDVFLGTLTPRETLQFAAKLQLPEGISEERKLKRVERVIQQLDLSHIADTPIGGMFSKGISGGQKRRVSVGIELIKDPSVIFLDEPTSGLDSNTAVNVMKVLKHLSQTGRTVIFTIHSPNSKILEMFDTLILLSRGKLAYFGPAKRCLPYFSSFGYDCPLYSNQAEFFLNVLTPHSLAMYHSLLSNTHHAPEEMITPMDPRFKSILLLRAQLGLHTTRSNRAVPVHNMAGIGLHGGFINYSQPQFTEQSQANAQSGRISGTESVNSFYIDPKLVAINRINSVVPVYTTHGGVHWVNVTSGLVHGDLDGNKHATSRNQAHHDVPEKIRIDWSLVDWTLNYMGYADSLLGSDNQADDNWCVYVNGVKQETLRQKRRRILIEQQYLQYQLYDTYCEENHPNTALELSTLPSYSGQVGSHQFNPQSGSFVNSNSTLSVHSNSLLAPAPNERGSVLHNMIATGLYQRDLKNLQNGIHPPSSQSSFSHQDGGQNSNTTLANAQSLTKLHNNYSVNNTAKNPSSTSIYPSNQSNLSTTTFVNNQSINSSKNLVVINANSQQSASQLSSSHPASNNHLATHPNMNTSMASICDSFFIKHHHDHDFYYANQQYHINPITNGSRMWNYSLFPQSTHIYQQFFVPPRDPATKQSNRHQSAQSPPPPPNPSSLSSIHYQSLISYPPTQLYDINKIILAREDNRLTMITDAYLKHPVQPNPQYTPFLTNYVPKLRELDKTGAASLAEIGFDIPTTQAKDGSGVDKKAEKKQIERMGLLQPGKAPLPWSKQLLVLTHRTFLHTMRDPLNTVARLAVNMLLTVFVGFLFFQTGNYQTSLYARVGFLFFMTSIQAFITVMGAVLTFSEERALFIREYQKQIYATSSYFLGRSVIDIILQTVLSIVFGSLAYPMVGLQPSFGKFVQYTICLIMVAQGSHSYALILGALVPYRTVALMLSPIIMVPFLTVSGFLCPLNQLSPTISWLTWFSPQRWMFDAMMNIEMTGLKFACKDSEYITIPLDNGTMERVCPVSGGEEVLALFGLSRSSTTFITNLIAVIIIAVVMKFVALFALKFSAWHHTKSSTGA